MVSLLFRVGIYRYRVQRDRRRPNLKKLARTFVEFQDPQAATSASRHERDIWKASILRPTHSLYQEYLYLKDQAAVAHLGKLADPHQAASTFVPSTSISQGSSSTTTLSAPLSSVQETTLNGNQGTITNSLLNAYI